MFDGAAELNLGGVSYSGPASIEFDESTAKVIKSVLAEDEALTKGMVDEFKIRKDAASNACASLREYVHVLLDVGVDVASIRTLWIVWKGNPHTLQQYLTEETPKADRVKGRGRKVLHPEVHEQVAAFAAIICRDNADLKGKAIGSIFRSVGTKVANGDIVASPEKS